MQWEAMEARTPMENGRGRGEKSIQGLEGSRHGGLLAGGRGGAWGCLISHTILTWLRVDEEKGNGFSEGLDLGQEEEVPTAHGLSSFLPQLAHLASKWVWEEAVHRVTSALAAWRRLAAPPFCFPGHNRGVRFPGNTSAINISLSLPGGHHSLCLLKSLRNTNSCCLL